MAQTIIGINDPKEVKKWSGDLAVDVAKTGYFNKKFIGPLKSRRPIVQLFDLESGPGAVISYDLSVQLKMMPVEGLDKLAGKEEALKFYTDTVRIDKARGGVNTGDTMTRKRTLHDLRDVAKSRESEWWARAFDELFFMYLSGARGTNSGWIYPLTYAGFAGNALTAPDTDHLMYGGDATSKASVDAADKMVVGLIDRAMAKATMMGGGTEETPQIQPIMIDGEEHFVLLISPWQKYDLKRETGEQGWLAIQKAAAGAEGRNNPIFKGSLGMYDRVVIHDHKNVIRFTDYGAGSNVAAARALFMGAQAGVIAFGTKGSGLRFDWHEEMDDRGEEPVITTRAIFGMKKCTFNSKDFGVIAIDTAAANPG